MPNIEKASIYTMAKMGNRESFYEKLKFEKKTLEQVKDLYDSQNITLLQHTIIGRNFDIAKEILYAGVNVNAQNLSGWTALHYITERQNIEVAKILLEMGGDINIKEFEYGNTPFMMAVFNCKRTNYELVELFSKNSPDISISNNSGISPLQFANNIGDEKLIKCLESSNLGE